MRRYPVSLIARLEAIGNPYCSPDTLKFFDAFGGEVLRRERDTWELVESIKSPWDEREYRVTRFEFSGEEIEITQLTDNYESAYHAKRAYQAISVS